MVTSTKTLPKTGKGSSTFPGPNGNGKRRDGDEFPDAKSKANSYRIGMWVALASIAMLFTALSSAYIVRAASAQDWISLAMPRVLLVSTALILLSSISLEISRRNLKASAFSSYGTWLLGTILLGLLFLGSQLVAWRQLAAQGVYLSSNPHSSFFYLMTAAHGIHLIVGLLLMVFLWVRSRLVKQVTVTPRRQASADAVTIYWHFMDALWIYLFLLLFLWR